MAVKDRFDVEVITPQGCVLNQVSAYTKVPGAIGEIGVYPNHTATLANLKPGELLLKDMEGNDTSFFIASGVAQVTEEKVVLLVPFLEKLEDIDKGRAESAKDRAVERLKETKAAAELDLSRAKYSLDRAEARLALLLKHKR